MKNYYWRFRFESKELDGRTVVDSSCVIASTAKKAREAAEYRIIDMGYVLEDCKITSLVAYKECERGD